MPRANVSASVVFGDDRVRQALEVETIETARRIDALQELRSAGIATSAMVCPVIPYLTDVRPLIETLAPLADAIWVYRLSVHNESQCGWRNVKDVLEREFPESKEVVETAVLAAEHPYWETLRRDLQGIREKHDLDLRIHV
jgi:DNA repair photolyase